MRSTKTQLIASSLTKGSLLIGKLWHIFNRTLQFISEMAKSAISYFEEQDCSTHSSVLYNSCIRAYLLRSLPGLIGCNIILNKTKVFKTGGRSSLLSFTVVDRFCLC